MTRAVLWQLDGVVVESAEAHFRSWVTALAEWEIPLERDALKRLLGLENVEVLAAILGRPPQPQEKGTILSRKEHFFRIESEHLVRLNPGVDSLLSELHAAGWSQGLFSSMPQATMDLVVDQLEIRDHFQAVLSAEALADARPGSSLLLEMAQLLRVEPEKTVLVDATPEGVQAAQRAGMHCLAVATIRPRDALVAADHVAKDVSDLRVATFDRLVRDHE